MYKLLNRDYYEICIFYRTLIKVMLWKKFVIISRNMKSFRLNEETTKPCKEFKELPLFISCYIIRGYSGKIWELMENRSLCTAMTGLKNAKT